MHTAHWDCGAENWAQVKMEYPALVEFSRDVEKATIDRDDKRLFEACWNLITRVIGAVLQQMGSPAGGDVLAAIERARQLEPSHRDRFDNSSQPMPPSTQLPKLADAAYWVRLALALDVPRLPPGAPFKGIDHLMRSVANASHQLLAATGTPEELGVPRFEGAESVVTDTLQRSSPISLETIATVVDMLEKRHRSDDWKLVRELPYADELHSRRSFLTDLVVQDPPEGPLAGVWVGIFNPVYEGHTTLDTYVMGATHYDRQDPSWPERLNWRPAARYVRSEILSRLHDIGYRYGNLEMGADLTALTFVAVLASHLADEYSRQLGGSRIGVCVGFDSGDPIHLRRS